MLKIALFTILLMPVFSAKSETFSIESTVKDAEDGNYKIVHTDAYLNHSTRCVWNVIQTPESFPDFMPRVKKAHHLGTQEKDEKFYVVLDPPFPLKDIISVLSVHFDASTQSIRWIMLDGNITKNSGHLTLTGVETGSHLSMDVTLDFGGFWPKAIIAWGVKSYLPKIIRSLNEKIETTPCAKTT
ncbi:MAG: hypothetical protein KDD48_07090 [Bdellovibrionales bacterium]|nr:hypothetical protein [Bdellovibrionales bacterium]